MQKTYIVLCKISELHNLQKTHLTFGVCYAIIKAVGLYFYIFQHQKHTSYNFERSQKMTENTKPVALMTIHEAAKTGIMPENTLRRMCKNNEVPCLHIGKRTLINFDVLVSFLNDPDNYVKEAGPNV